NHLSKLNSWVEIACKDGTKLSHIFSLRTAHSGDGKTKELALFFWKARTHREAMQADFEELRRGGMMVSEEVLFGAGQKKHRKIVFRCDSGTRRAGARA